MNYTNDTEIKRATITHPDGETSYSYIFRVGPLTSSVYKTEAAAKGGLTRMLKRHAHCGGIPERWLKKHGKLVYEYAVRRMVAGRQGEQ